MLLFVDGLCEEWIGHEGLFDFYTKSQNIQSTLQRLASPNEQSNYDVPGMDSG